MSLSSAGYHAATALPSLQFLTQEDFEQIRAKQLAQKLEPSMSRKRKAQEIEKELLEARVEGEVER